VPLLQQVQGIFDSNGAETLTLLEKSIPTQPEIGWNYELGWKSLRLK
jgi:hypothetical protein